MTPHNHAGHRLCLQRSWARNSLDPPRCPTCRKSTIAPEGLRAYWNKVRYAISCQPLRLEMGAVRAIWAVCRGEYGENHHIDFGQSSVNAHLVITSSWTISISTTITDATTTTISTTSTTSVTFFIGSSQQLFVSRSFYSMAIGPPGGPCQGNDSMRRR